MEEESVFRTNTMYNEFADPDELKAEYEKKQR